MREIRSLKIIILLLLVATNLEGFTMRYLGSIPIPHSIGYSLPCFGTVGDLNGDGFDDIVLGYPLTVLDSAAVYFCNDWWYGSTEPDLWVTGARLKLIADVNGDGIGDLIIASSGGGKVLLGATDFTGEVGASFRIPGGGGGYAIDAADINGDGADDILAEAGATLYIYYGGEELDSLPSFVLHSPRGIVSIRHGDFNGDGFIDIVTGNLGDSLVVWYGTPYINSGWDYALGGYLPDSTRLLASKPLVGDLNGDGVDDIAIISDPPPDPEDTLGIYAGPNILIYLGSEYPDTVVDLIIPRNYLTGNRTNGFLNYDRCKDFIADWVYPVMDCLFQVFLGGSAIDFIPDFRVEGSSGHNRCGDINGDGADDIVAVRTAYNGGPPVRVEVWAGDTTSTGVPDNSFTAFMQMGLKAYPNPFNDKVRIELSIPQNMKLNIEIFNDLGMRVKTLGKGVIRKGRRSYVWDGKNEEGKRVSNGVYYLRIVGRGDIERRVKLIYLK